MSKKIIYILSILLIIAVGIVIIFDFSKYDKWFSGKDNNTSAQQNPVSEKEIKDFNDVVNKSGDKLDIKDCDSLSNLKDLCISQIKDKLRPENSYTDIKQCEKVSIKTGEAITQTQDICILNTTNRIAKNINDARLCESIKSTELKTLCITQINNKFN